MYLFLYVTLSVFSKVQDVEQNFIKNILSTGKTNQMFPVCSTTLSFAV